VGRPAAHDNERVRQDHALVSSSNAGAPSALRDNAKPPKAVAPKETILPTPLPYLEAASARTVALMKTVVVL
jgi:hypothetical protein